MYILTHFVSCQSNAVRVQGDSLALHIKINGLKDKNIDIIKMVRCTCTMPELRTVKMKT